VGSIFTIALPLQTAAGVTDGPHLQELSPVADQPTCDSRTILLVEDDPQSADLMTLYLHEAGLEVAIARDGEEGLAVARSIRPAVIVLDVLLPGLNGWEFIERAKSDPALHETSIIVTTVVDDRVRAMALGASEYLIKPVSREQLLNAISAIGMTMRDDDDTRTVLAIDDEPMTLQLIETVLSSAGYRVLTAAGGEQGILLAQERQPDLVILDLLMDDVDGFAVVERMRQEPQTSGIPILVLTSKSVTNEDRNRLDGRVTYMAQKASFSRQLFIELVQRYARPIPV
jgi:DNA-binding response OmpR family regulator